jgi:peptidoglycan/xylan/chitin deacetylase (PgdA/CDA1 family)
MIEGRLAMWLAMLICLAAISVDSAAGPAQPTIETTVPHRFRGNVISSRIPGLTDKLLALTIDDGPSPNITPGILDTLKSHGAHATFFILGANAARHPELLRRMVAEGHAIGSHTYSHPIHPSREQAILELEKTAEAIQKAVGFRPSLFRPPGGNLSSWTARLAKQQGYTIVLWTISTADTATRNPATIANNIIHTPNPGDIALMHDAETKAATAEALPRILEELGEQGWKFVTIPELLAAWEGFLETHPAHHPPQLGIRHRSSK